MNTVEPVAWMTESEDGAQMFWPTRTEAARGINASSAPAKLKRRRCAASLRTPTTISRSKTRPRRLLAGAHGWRSAVRPNV